MGVAMLDMQLDTRESHELGYVSLKFLRATGPIGWVGACRWVNSGFARDK